MPHIDGTCGGGSGIGRPLPFELPCDGSHGKGAHSGMSAEDVEDVKDTVAHDIEIHQRSSKSRGGVPGGFVVWKNGRLAPAKIPWNTLLSRAISQSASQVVMGTADHRIRNRTPRTNSSTPGIHLPKMISYAPNISVVLDTSGSMDGEPLEQALGEIDRLLRAQRQKGAKVSLSCTDAKVHGGIQRINSLKQAKISGGGGTDMDVGVLTALTKDKKLPPDILVVITDGITPWPQHMPKNVNGRIPKVILALVNDDPASVWGGYEQFVKEGKGQVINVDLD